MTVTTAATVPVGSAAPQAVGPAAASSLRSRLLLRAHATAGRTVLGAAAGHGQIVARQTGEGRVHLVGQAAGPLNGDDLELRVEVGPGADLTVASTAATIALPGDRADAVSRIRVTAVVGEGARLLWALEPLVAATGAVVHTQTRLEVAATARLTYFDTVVLGRHGEDGGRVRAGLQVVRDGGTVLSQTLDSVVLDRPAGVERVLATALLMRPEPWPAQAVVVGGAVAVQPAAGVLLATATASFHQAAAAALAGVLEAAASG